VKTKTLFSMQKKYARICKNLKEVKSKQKYIMFCHKRLLIKTKFCFKFVNQFGPIHNG